MAIIAARKSDDAKGKCTRWRVVVYNRHNKKQKKQPYEWHTVYGGKRDAEALDRQLKERFRK